MITGDLRDVNFRLYPYNEWNDTVNDRITVTDVVDDLRIFVRIKKLEEGVAGLGGPFQIRTENMLPILGAIALDRDELNSDLDSFYSLVLHEMGHCLGFGTIWDGLGLLNEPSTDNPLADRTFRVLWQGSGSTCWAVQRISGPKYPCKKTTMDTGEQACSVTS